MSTCLYTGFPTGDRWSIVPLNKTLTKGTGRYLDLNCALAHQLQRAKEGLITRKTVSRWVAWVVAKSKYTTIAPAPERRPGQTKDEFIESYQEYRIGPESNICARSVDDDTRDVILGTTMAVDAHEDPVLVTPAVRIPISFRMTLPTGSGGSATRFYNDVDDWGRPMKNAGYNPLAYRVCQVLPNGVRVLLGAYVEASAAEVMGAYGELLIADPSRGARV